MQNQNIKKTPTMEGILNELSDTLKGRITKFDVVISVERSGYRIFQRLENDYLKSGVLHIPSESLHLINVRDRNILLFDDATTTGSKLKEMTHALEQRGARVETMVYAILDSLPNEDRPNYYAKIAKFKEYQEIIHRISESMTESELPLDTDHMQVEGNIMPSSMSCKDIYSTLTPLGDVYQGSSFHDGCQFGLRDPNFCDISSLKLPFVTNSVRTWKIRLKYTPNGKIKIIPLSFPVLDFVKGQCNKVTDMRFCESYRHLFDKSKESEKLLCCFCIIFNSSRALLLAFLKSWKQSLKEKGFKLNVEKVVYEDARLIFNNSDVEIQLLSEINRVLE